MNIRKDLAAISSQTALCVCTFVNEAAEAVWRSPFEKERGKREGKGKGKKEERREKERKRVREKREKKERRERERSNELILQTHWQATTRFSEAQRRHRRLFNRVQLISFQEWKKKKRGKVSKLSKL